eukprot:g18854.t1
MAIVEVPTPVALLAGLLAMALSAHHMTARSKTGVLGKVAALVNMLCFLNASLGVNVVMALIYLFVRPFSSATVRKLNSNFAEAMWADAVSAIMPPAKVVVTGEMPDDDTQAIVIANHQVDTDWWFLFELLRPLRRHGALKIILKDDQKHVPVTGWGMRGFGFIFLKRDWLKDRANLEKQLGVFTGDGFPLRLLIFPEGTTINQRSMDKCANFAKKEQRPTFEHLLLPRTTGFGACLNAFNCAENSGAGAGGRGGDGGRTGGRDRVCSNRVVYDVTMAYTGYSGEIPTWEMGYTRDTDVDIPNLGALLKGRAPGPVHLHVEKHHVEDIAGDGKAWLDATWARKDALLQRFIEDGRFPHQPVAVYESRKSPMAFLFLSATPIFAFLLLYYGITDALALLAATGVTAAAGGGGGGGGVEGIAEAAAAASGRARRGFAAAVELRVARMPKTSWDDAMNRGAALVFGGVPAMMLVKKLRKVRDAFKLREEMLSMMGTCCVCVATTTTIQVLVIWGAMPDSRGAHVATEVLFLLLGLAPAPWSLVLPIARYEGWIGLTKRSKVVHIKEADGTSNQLLFSGTDGVLDFAVDGGVPAELFGVFCEQNMCSESWDFVLMSVHYEMVRQSQIDT